MDILDLAADLKEFAEKLLGPSAEELGLIGGEKIRLLRFKSSIKTFKRAKEMLKEAGFSDPRPVELKTLVPLLEYCSLENDDSDLIEKWAGLLASACSDGLRSYSYPQILNQLSPKEAKILDEMYGVLKNIRRELRWVKDIGLNRFSFKLNNDEDLIYIYNLNRLGLVEFKDEGIGKLDGGFKDDNYYKITPLGMDFIEACLGPNKQ